MERIPNYRFATEKPDHIMVSFSGDPRTEMTVTWRQKKEIENGFCMLYESENATQGKKVRAVRDIFKSDVNSSSIFFARLTDLEPGKRYYYTCGDDFNTSERFYFDTQPENLTHFRFLAISDHQKDTDHYNPSYAKLNKFLKKVLKENPDIKFILTAGDNTNCGQHEIQWNAMYEGMQGIIEHIPYMMTCGNHDNRGMRSYFPEEEGRYYAEPAEFFNNQHRLSYPTNGPEGWQTENYSFDYGNAHFLVLGVNEPELVNDWAVKDLDKSDKTWKFGAYHFPIYYAGPNLSNDDAYPMMRPCMERLDVLFGGHEHNFSRSFPIRNEEIFDKPSQGTVHYELGNGNSNPPGTHTTFKLWHSSFYPQEEEVSAYAIIEVDGKKASFVTRLDDGRTVDECIIDKEKDEIRPYRVAPVFGKGRTRLFYKGCDLGLCMEEIPPVCKDGKWFVPFGSLISYIGGEAKREKGKMTLSAYGKSAVFTAGSDIAKTDSGEVTLSAPVFYGAHNQLFVELDSACKIFKMKWAYAKRNNFLTVENADEGHPIPKQE